MPFRIDNDRLQGQGVLPRSHSYDETEKVKLCGSHPPPSACATPGTVRIYRLCIVKSHEASSRKGSLVESMAFTSKDTASLPDAVKETTVRSSFLRKTNQLP
jgi:hypothetical protein